MMDILKDIMLFIRDIEYYPEQAKFIIQTKYYSKIKINIKFDIGFHLEPTVKLIAQDNKAVLIELEDEGQNLLAITSI